MSQSPNWHTPPDLRVAADNVRNERLPEKSKDDYLKAYNDFIRWHQVKKVPDGYFSENVLMAYFHDLAEAYAPTTMASRLSMVKATLPLKHPATANLNWASLEKWVYAKRDKWNAKKSLVFTRAQVDAFLRCPDTLLLAKKLIFAFGVYGGMRKSEIVKLAPSDVKLVDGKLEVQITDAKTGDRWFMISPHEDPALNIVEMYKRYVAMRPPGAPPDRFFIRYTEKGKCTRQPIGKNVVGVIPAFVATTLQLENATGYTSHAMRRTGATLLADEGCDFLNLKRFGAWKSDKVAQGYVANSKAAKSRVSTLVQGAEAPKKMKMTAYAPPGAAHPAPAAAARPPSPVSLPQAATGPTFNFLGSNNQINVYMLPTGATLVQEPRPSPAVIPAAVPVPSPPPAPKAPAV